MQIKVTLKKLRGKICSTLAKYPVTHKWPTYWWRKCGYSIGKNASIGPDCLIWAWHHLDTGNINNRGGCVNWTKSDDNYTDASDNTDRNVWQD